MPKPSCVSCQRQSLGKRRARIARSGDLPPPSPPAEQATTRQDQTGQASADNGSRNRCGCIRRRGEHRCTNVTMRAESSERENLIESERLAGNESGQRNLVGVQLTIAVLNSAEGLTVAESGRTKH